MMGDSLKGKVANDQTGKQSGPPFNSHNTRRVKGCKGLKISVIIIHLPNNLSGFSVLVDDRFVAYPSRAVSVPQRGDCFIQIVVCRTHTRHH